MKTKNFHFRSAIAACAVSLILAAIASAATPDVTARLDRSEIALGDSAQLTITVAGGDDNSISPPNVPGLEFVSVGQTSQYQSINGVATSTSSATYEVIPQRTGTFTIPSVGGGSAPLVLHVQSGSSRRGKTTPGNHLALPNLQPPPTSGMLPGDAQLTQDGAAFVRLRMPKKELYVGEMMPVDIQVGLRPGLVASLNGLPSLNGDAFTLNPLSSQPEKTQEFVEGQPYTVLTWHSALAAVKPGDFSLAVETPLTVQIRTKPQRRGGNFGDSLFDDPFNDPFFQNFFGSTTEKEITATSAPDTLKVLPLPTTGRPTHFSGAVGKFEVSSELSAAKSNAGDPLTLRLKVTGTGNFERVNSPMLGEQQGWRTYKPSAKFEPSDNAGYGGAKTFEQAIIPLQSGQQTVPALAFSFFNPETRRYQTKLTAPLAVDVMGSSTSSAVTTATPASTIRPTPSERPSEGLRPDRAETGGAIANLEPLYFQPWFVSLQGTLVLCFAGGLLFLRQRERRAKDLDAVRRRLAANTITGCLNEMSRAASAGDVSYFFSSARAALQQSLAGRWQVAPASITIAELDERMSGDHTDVRRIFALADEAAYSGQHLSTADFQQWMKIVREQLKQTEAACDIS